MLETMERFSCREYKEGDAEAINDLYFKITSRRRSLEEYLWQWHQSPSGLGSIWLIRDNECDGKLVGHHGIMPLRFTSGKQDLVFGKTENTMVLPEYRSKILYPRYERRFKDEYESRYHALFSTMGPPAAIRMREALGYSPCAKWYSLLVRTSLFSEFRLPAFVGARVLNRSRPPSQTRVNGVAERMVKAGFLESGPASRKKFFEGFWNHARHNHGVAPRRDVADLMWRFWTNPHKEHFTYVLDSERCAGYVIVSVRDRLATLEDYAVSLPSGEGYSLLFAGVLYALADADVDFLGVSTTDDGSLRDANKVFFTHQSVFDRLLKMRRNTEIRRMPRHITSIGQAVDLSLEDWMVTAFVFEGR